MNDYDEARQKPTKTRHSKRDGGKPRSYDFTVGSNQITYKSLAYQFPSKLYETPTGQSLENLRIQIRRHGGFLGEEGIKIPNSFANLVVEHIVEVTTPAY